MRTILIYLFFVILSFSCGSQQNNEHADNNESATEFNKEENKTEMPEIKEESETLNLDTAFLNLPLKTDKEANRYLDDNNILHIDLTESKVLRKDESQLLDNMFPDSEIELVIKDDAYDAFDIIYNEESFNAIIMHENSGKSIILSHIIISKGKFKTEILELLFS